jgi:carbamoyltransferase
MQERNVQAIFNELLSQTVQGNMTEAIKIATQHFVTTQSNFQQLVSRNLLNNNSDLLKVFIIAFRNVQNFQSANTLLQRFAQIHSTNDDFYHLYNADYQQKTGNRSEARDGLGNISFDSPFIKEKRQLMSELDRVEQEERNINDIKQLASNVNFDLDDYYIFGMKPIGHDSHVSIVDKHGRVVYEAEEERFNRKKHSDTIPLNSILAGMKQCNIHPAQVKHIAFSFSALEYSKSVKRWENYYKENNLSLENAQMVRAGHINYERYSYMQKYMESIFFNAKVDHIKHHLAHCGGAFYSSPFKNSAILSIDGRGEFETVMFAKGNGDTIEELDRIDSPHSLGTLYQSITYWLGLGSRQEGKTIGLSSYGDPDVYYKTFLDRIIDIDPQTGKFTIHADLINPDGIFLYDHTKYSDIFKIHHSMNTKTPQPEFAHVAAALQKVTEEIFLGLSRYIKEISGEEYLCMTGGVALNSVGNGKILKSGLFKDVCIHPAAHDGGTGLGAALYVYYNNVKNHVTRDETWWVMEHPYYGSVYKEDDIVQAITASGFPLRKHENSIKFAAEKLAEGNIIGWYQGKMEVGPRALGNRSILGDPRQPDMKDNINKRVKFRESWRPFAPSVLLEDCVTYFDVDHESPYMLFVYNTREEYIDKLQAITHVDGTARVQTVERDKNPRYYELISEFKKITGVGMVLNTSLNVKGEPIICTPNEAIDCFLTGGMDYMILEDYIVDKNDLPGSIFFEKSYDKSLLLNIPTRTGRINGFTNIDIPSSNCFDDLKTNLFQMNEFRDNQADLIHSHYYLQTLSRPKIKQLLAEWKRILKEEASIIIDVPQPVYNPSHDEIAKKILQESLKNKYIERYDGKIVTELPFDELARILEEAGFSEIEQKEKSFFHPEKIGCLTVKAKKKTSLLVPEYEDLRNYLNVTDREIDEKASDESVQNGVHKIWISKSRTTASEIASAYNETDLLLFRRVYYSRKTQWRNVFINQMLESILQCNSKNLFKILDYGCGSACLHKLFCKHMKVEITLADIESPCFNFTKWRFKNQSNIVFFDIDPEKLLLSEMYDFFICDNVLEHVLNPLELIQHITEHLNPQGYALIDFCTNIEKYKTGHLKESIDQYDITMAYVHENYHKINKLFFKKKK